MSRPAVTLVDYGAGNLHSVIKALREVGAEVEVTEAADCVCRAERLILPGVGAYGDGMRGLAQRGLIPALHDYMTTERPFLGICLGMQMMLGDSEEFGHWEGLGAIPGHVVPVRPEPGIKVPHMGWNRIAPPSGASRDWQGTILADIQPGTRMYFVHSFAGVPECESHRLADTDYGGFRISAAIQRGALVGCQFHPEKSGPAGLQILARFLAV